jgi:hypothetical protein
LGDLTIAEMADKLYRETADAMISVHHQQGTVWNNFIKEVGQRYQIGSILTKEESL